MLFGTLDYALADDLALAELVDILALCVQTVDGGLDDALFLVRGAFVGHVIACVRIRSKARSLKPYPPIVRNVTDGRLASLYLIIEI